MKKKSNISGKIQKSRKWWKTHEMLEDVEIIEAKLSEEYKQRTLKDEEKAVPKITKDTKFFYSNARKKSKSPNKVGPFLKPDGSVTEDAQQKAESLRIQYKTMFSQPDLKWKIEDPDNFFEIDRQRLLELTEACEDDYEIKIEDEGIGEDACEYYEKVMIHECDEDRTHHQ